MSDPNVEYPHIAAVLALLHDKAPNPEMFEGFVIEAVTVYSRQMARIRIPLDTKLDDKKRELIKWRDLSKHIDEKMEMLHANLPENLRGDHQEK